MYLVMCGCVKHRFRQKPHQLWWGFCLKVPVGKEFKGHCNMTVTILLDSPYVLMLCVMK
jgi:hypothetical protein